MKRIAQTPRAGWQQKLQDRGFHFHSIDPEGVDKAGQTDKFMYWREDIAYEFTEKQIEHLYEVTRSLHGMSMELVEEIIKKGDMERMKIGSYAQQLIEQSYKAGDPHVYGRFDLWFDGVGEPKMLEYNADTPTSLIEASVAQWWWKEEVHPKADQFNSIHEALVERWAAVAKHYEVDALHLGCIYDSQEDVGNTEYMMETALQAGLSCQILDMESIGLSEEGSIFVDEKNQGIQMLFKLYPWEWLVGEEYAGVIAKRRCAMVEPAWKMLLSNKALLPLLWEKYKGHPNLLPSWFEGDAADGRYTRVLKKPIFSREGANITLMDDNGQKELTGGSYGEEGFIYQVYKEPVQFEAPEATSFHGPQKAMYPVIGSWVVGNEAVGIGVREDITAITSNTAYFVPHYFK